ncbi:transposase, partial [Cohnella sp.]|uniref:transposase n=1 Tax=Cohnella sp. TaxID=1883426 RepID=UPI00356210C3
MYRDHAAFKSFCCNSDNEDECIQALFEAKWPNGFRCPRCEHTLAYLISTRRLPLYECKSCHQQTSLTVGTIFEGSRTPLHLWFQALFLHTQTNSVNALQLSQII